MIGREREIKELEKLYNSNKAELVAVYGRRRVGKTFLINQFFHDNFTFKHAGLSPEDKTHEKEMDRQLNQFYSNLVFYGLENCAKPNDWFEAFNYLRLLLTKNDTNKRMVVFIDELPWMDTKGSDFIKAFEGFWNSYACAKDNLMVIICGSATSWMENNLINNHGGLYGRVTYEIKLLPFTLKECEDFLKFKNIEFSKYDITLIYMILGGIPYYLNYIDNEYSVSQNIDNLFFKKNAKLEFEFERLFKSIFTYSDKAKEIVKLLYTKNFGYTRKEISEKTGIKEGGTLSTYLSGLIASNFVVKYNPFGLSKRETYYKLIDPFCLFYLNFCQNKYNSEDFFTENIYSNIINSWAGFSFENVCFNHIDQIKFALGILGVSTEESAYFNKEDGYQIDLILTRKDNIINICEIKFYSSKFNLSKDYYLKVNNRINMIKEKVGNKYSIMSTLISTYGLNKSQYSNAFVKSITLEDLFKF